MAVAEAALEQPPAEKIDDVADDDLFCGTRQRIPAFFAARRLHEPALAEHTQDLGCICGRDTLRQADLGDRQRLALESRVRETHEAADAIFFIRRQLHLRSLAIGMMSS